MKRLLARDLSVSPPGPWLPTVENVDLEVTAGERIAVTGPNGGGKSSLLLGLAGLWPSRGRLDLDGRAFGPQAMPEARRRLAVIFQDPTNQLLQGSVYDEIAFAPRNLGRPDAEVESLVGRWAGRLELSADLERDPVRLSAGRQQLVLLAAALAGEPEVLLADEATSHMDAEARARALEVVEEEIRRGMAVIWITQFADEAASATRTLIVGSRAGSAPRSRPVPWTARSNAPQRTRPSERLATVWIAPPAGPMVGPTVRVDAALEFDIPSSGVVALLGANGVGKSVALGAVAGLGGCPQLSVQWHVEGGSPPIAALQFPEQQLFEERAEDELVYSAVSRGAPRAEVLDRGRGLLERLGMRPNDFLGRRTWTLAGGERRLLETVAALVTPASICLLDEPTAGLDDGRREALGEIIREIGAVSPILLASQDREWVLSLSAQVVDLGPNPVPHQAQRLKNPLTVG